MSNVNVLVYNGSGVSASSRDHTIRTLRSFLGRRYDVQLVTPKSLREEPWTETCALLVFPGGRDLPYLYDLSGKANKRIKTWVESGGKYLGFCAGAYYASGRVEFELGTNLQVVGDRELCFFPGVCSGTVFPGFEYDTELGAREVVVELERSAWRDYWVQSPASVPVWYNGGGAFVFDESISQNSGLTVLARYNQLLEKPVAGVRCKVGAGEAILWAVHPEHPTFIGARSSPSEPLPGPIAATFAEKEERRIGLLRATLGMLGLDVAEHPSPAPQLMPLWLASSKPELAFNIAAAIEAKAKDKVQKGQPEVDCIVFRDRNDDFRLFSYDNLFAVTKAAHDRPGSEDLEVLRTTPKDIIACTTTLPPPTYTPLFDLALYFDELNKATMESSPDFGHALLYGEVVTSTQTMLDKNDRFLSVLPTGLSCIASHQIAGRGRGGNSWVSPAGCLQFSTVVRLPATQSRKIVFIQYLFGLAVVEAVRGLPGYESVGVHLKWPNDIYGDVGGEGNLKYRKVGGILVNSSFAGDNFTLVVGCGVNLSNSKPTTSINELISFHNHRTGSQLEPIRPERLLALILTTFGRMWNPFFAEGFEPFTDRYLTRWIHQNQRVTIQSTSQVVRIVGITPDHGLLRTVQVDLDRNGQEVYGGGGGSDKKPYIDLQPDGNGFDMLQSLLVSKS